MSFVSPDTGSISNQTYTDLVAKAIVYYDNFLSNFYANQTQFVSLDLFLNFTLDAGKAPSQPFPRFNIYMEFSGGIAMFARSAKNPTSFQLFQSLRGGLVTAFIVDPVRTFTGTPLAQVSEAFIQTL
jgi:hypothetical protein